MKIRILPAFIVIIVGLVLWQVSEHWSLLVRDIIGTPSVIAVELVDVLMTSSTWQNLAVTAFELGLGLALATIIGLALSIGLGTDEGVHVVVEPLLLVGNTIPKVILLPMFLMLLGTGYSSKIAFGALHGMLPIAIIVSNGARKVLVSDQARAAISMDATTLQFMRLILFPAVLPYLVTALRLAVSLTLLGVILGEMYVAKAGLGFLLMRLYGEMQISKMFGVVIIIACMAAILDLGLRQIEVRVWRDHGLRRS